MNVLDFTIISVEGISERKLRFSLNLIGIIIGCAAVTGIISMTGGMRTSIIDDISIFGTNTIQVFPVAGGDEAFNVLDWRDLNKLKNIPGVEAAAPVMAGRYATYEYGGEVQRNQVAGVDLNYFVVHGGENELEDGRLFENSDYGVALLGSNVWHVDDEARYSVGDRIRLTSEVNGETIEYSVRIVGILKLTSGIAQTGIDDLIVIPLSYFEQIYDMNGKYAAIDLKAETLDDVDDIKQYIDEEFDDIGYYSMDMIMEEVDQLIGTINAVLGGIAAISLVVAGVTIINTMTISVMERTREIGVMKAIGATNNDVLFLFISESMVTGLVGGGLGALLGFGLSTVIGGYIGLPPQISLDLGVTVTFFAIVTCIISGVYPAWRASNLNPVEALRDE
jgi:putative ABC transport system permease protein